MVAPSPVRPNAGIRTQYQRKLEALIDELDKSLRYWIAAAYKANPPEIAQDASPAMTLRATLRKLGRRWLKKFDALGPEMARYFAQSIEERSTLDLKASLRKAGLTVKFKATKAQNDALQAVIGANISLIKSIATKHLTSVEGIVMQGVQVGRDLGTITKGLQEAHGVTRRRAAFIARDQTNKATRAFVNARYDELGIVKSRWLHSAGGKHKRPSHVAFSGQTYDLKKGAYLDGIWTHPGLEPGCKCVDTPVIPGFND